MSAITVKYGDTDIAYDERRNLWCFELRGRQRSAPSLEKAKEAIDKPAPEKAKPFERIEAWMKRWQEPFRLVIVTSVAEKAAYYAPRVEVWILDGKERKKVSLDDLYARNEHNDQLVANYATLGKEKDAIEEKRNEIVRTLGKLEIAAEEEVSA